MRNRKIIKSAHQLSFYLGVCTFLLLAPLVQGQQILEDSALINKDSVTHTLPTQDSTFSISELTLRIEDAGEILHEIETAPFISDTITIVIPEFSALANNVNSLIMVIGQENLSSYNLNQLKNLQNKFIRFNAQLEDWQEQTFRKTERVSKQKRELSQINRDFSEDFFQLEDTTLAPLYQQRLTQIQQQANHLNQRVTSSLKQLVIIQNQLAEIKVNVNNQLDDLESYTFNYQLNLLHKDASPLWDIATYAESGFFLQLSANLGNGILVLYEYLGDNKLNLYLQIGLFLLLLYALYSIKNHALTINEKRIGPNLDKVLYVLQHPWSSALLITLLLGPFLYSHPPIILIQVSFILMLIPLVVIVEGRSNKVELICSILICLAYTLAQLESLMIGQSFGQRILSILASLLSISCIYLFIKQARQNLKKYPPFFLQILITFIGVFALAIVTNVMGYSSLSSMLNLATNQSLIFGILLFFSFRILTVLIYIITYSHQVQRSRVIKENQQSIFDNLKQIASIALTIYWFSLTLVSFNLYDISFDLISEFLTKTRALGSIEFNYISILIFMFVIWASVSISKFTKYILEQKYNNTSSTLRSAKSGYILLARYIILMFGFFLAIVAAGIPLDKITIILGALSVGIGFGLQNIVNNLVSGLILALERPIQTGDVIEVGKYMGVVKDIGIRSSTIKTFDGSEVIVPNANFIAGEVTNWTLSDKHYRIEILVGVAYGNDSGHVIQVLKETLENHDDIMSNPEPMVIFQGFGESSLDFRILFWCKNRDNWVILRSSIMEAIYKRLKQEKIEIPFPQRDLHIKTETPANGHSKVEHQTVRKKDSGEKVK